MQSFISLLFVCLLSFGLAEAKTLSAESIEGSEKVGAEDVAKLMREYSERDGEKIRKVFFVDTRSKKDLEQGGTIPGAVHLDVKKSSEFNISNIVEHPKFLGDILLFCNGHSCTRAEKATKKVLEWKKSGEDNGKIETVYYFRDGFPSYRDYLYDDGSKNPVARPY